MPDQHVFGSHLLLEEERTRFRNTVDQLEKQRAEAQEEVDELINALRRERDLGDEEIIFLKAQLRGISANKYEMEDKAEKLENDNEELKEELKKETYKRKKLKERFLELQDLVNDESVVLVKEIEKRDEQIEALKEDINEVKDEMSAVEAERDKAKEKEELLLEECEKLNNKVEDLEDQLKSSTRDIIAYKLILEEKGVNTDPEDRVSLKTDLEEETRKREELEAQLDEIKKTVDCTEQELLEDIAEKEKRIQQLKRALEDNEYLHQTKHDQLFLDNEKLKEDLENLKQQVQEYLLAHPSQRDLAPVGVSQEKYDQLLNEMEKEQEERIKLQNHFKDLKSYVDKDTSDLIAEVQQRDEVIESMNEKLQDLDNLEQLQAELDYEKKQRRIDQQKIGELRAAISQDKQDIVADSEKKSDMIRQLKSTLTDAKTNLERARYKQREIISNNQRLRADNQALQREIDDLRNQLPASPTSPTTENRKVSDLIEEMKDLNRDLEKERELRGQLASAMQELKHCLDDEEADLVDEIQKRDIIIANLQSQLREDTDMLSQQLNNHRRRESELLGNYQALADKIENVERDCEPVGHQPAIKDLEKDMFEDLSHWLQDEVRILDTGLADRVGQLRELETTLLRSNPNFDDERVHYVKELSAQEKEVNDLRKLNRAMERAQADTARKYQKKLEEMNRELEALRRRTGTGNIVSAPIHGSSDSLPIAVMDTVSLEESGLGLSVGVDSFDLQRATPSGQSAPSEMPEKYDDTKEKDLMGQLRQIYSNLDMCRQDINRVVESFHDRIVRHHPRLQRRDSPTRLDSRNIGSTINSLLEGYHAQVTDLINRLNTDSSTIARRTENLEDVVQQLESNLGQERARYDQLHSRCKSYRQEIQDLRGRIRDGNASNALHPMEGDHANHDLCQAVHELLNDIDSGPSTEERGRAPSIQEISRLLLPAVPEQSPGGAFSTPDGAAFKEDCDVIQEKTDELSDLVKGLHGRLDAQKQAKIETLQEKVKEYEQEMDRLRDLIGNESEKENEIEQLRERNRQLALSLRDSQTDLENTERKNSILTDKYKECNDALNNSVEELSDLRRKTREREAYVRKLQEDLRKADDKMEEKVTDNENLRRNCDELQEKAQQLSSLIKEVESKFVEKSRQYTLLDRELEDLKNKHRIIQDYCDKKQGKIQEMEEDLRDILSENKKLASEVEELTDDTQVKGEKIKELENRLDAKEQLIEELEKSSDKMAGDIEERDEVLRDMNHEVTKLEQDVEDKEDLIKQLEKDLEKQDQELEKQDHQLEDKEKELTEEKEKTSTVEEENKKLNDTVDQLEDLIEELKSDTEKIDKELEDKNNIVNDLRDTISDLEKEVVNAKDEEDKVLADVTELEKELEEKEKELDDAKLANEHIKDDLENAKVDIEQLKDDISKMEDYVKDLEETLKEEKESGAGMEDENEKLKEDADRLTDTVEEQKGDMNKLADIVNDLEKELEEADKDNQELKEENQELKKHLEDLAQQKQDILKEVQDAMNDIEGEREDYKANLQDLKDYLESQKDDMNQLKSQIVEKPEMADRSLQTDVAEARSVRQQTDELETMHVRIQTTIEDSKAPMKSRRVQTDVDPIMAAKATARKELRKSSSLHVLRNMMNTTDRPTQTERAGGLTYL